MSTNKAKNNRERGKRVQKAVATKLNALDIGILGGEDAITKEISLEIKSRNTFVGKGWMEQAEKNASNGRIPIVVVHITKENHNKDMVIMRIPVFEKLLKLLEPPKKEVE